MYRNKTKTARRIFVVLGFILTAVLLLAFCGAGAFDMPACFADHTLADGDALSLLKNVTDKPSDFRYDGSNEAAFGKVHRFQQTYDGVDVAGAQITISTDKHDNFLSSSGHYVNIPHFGGNYISPSFAIKSVTETHEESVACCEFVYFYDGEDVYPSYKILTSDLCTLYYVSALDGAILLKNSGLYVAMQNKDAFNNNVEIEVSSDGENFIMRDDKRNISVLDMNGKTISNFDYNAHLDKIYTSRTGTDFDPMAVTVYDHIAKAYDFYSDASNIGVSRFGVSDKNNNDDKDDDYKIFVLMNYGNNYTGADFRVLFDSETKDKLNYAYICVGNGEQKEGELYMQGKALDIIAHEYQHGVTAFTANLAYQGESGALDEAFSDIFGALVEGHDPTDLNSAFWTIGEDGVYDPDNKNLSLRSLIGGTPGQAYSVREQKNCTKPGDHSTHNCDNNYVHENSTIISHVQYELSSLSQDFFTREKIGTLWYSTLLKLTSNSSFLDFATAFVNSSLELGYPSNIIQNVKQALINVGILNENTHTVAFYGPENSTLSNIFVEHNDYISFDLIRQELEKDVVTDSYIYKFSKWQNSDGSDFDIYSLDFITSDIDVHAVYNIYCSATFVDENGAVLSREEYPLDSCVTPFSYSCSDPKYSFLGWHLSDADQSSPIDFSTFKIQNNVTFSPILSVNKRTLRFYSNGAVISEQTLDYGSFIQLPSIDSFSLDHDGFSFEGWYLDPNFSVKAENFTLSNDVNLYAKWTKVPSLPKTTIIIACSSVAAVALLSIILLIIIKKRRR